MILLIVSMSGSNFFLGIRSFFENDRLRSCALEKKILHFGSCKIQKERCMKNAFPMLPFSSSPGCGRSVMFGECHQGQEKFGGGSWVKSNWDLAQWRLCGCTFDLYGSQNSHRGQTSRPRNSFERIAVESTVRIRQDELLSFPPSWFSAKMGVSAIWVSFHLW